MTEAEQDYVIDTLASTLEKDEVKGTTYSSASL
jgi:hypothetical protein